MHMHMGEGRWEASGDGVLAGWWGAWWDGTAGGRRTAWLTAPHVHTPPMHIILPDDAQLQPQDPQLHEGGSSMAAGGL